MDIGSRFMLHYTNDDKNKQISHFEMPLKQLLVTSNPILST